MVVLNLFSNNVPSAEKAKIAKKLFRLKKKSVYEKGQPAAVALRDTEDEGRGVTLSGIVLTSFLLMIVCFFE